MIDTDKHEDLITHRWTVDENDPLNVVDEYGNIISRSDFTMYNVFCTKDEEREWQLANARLIADAPLLLAEVKELQAWKAEVERICRTMNGPNRDTALFIMTNEVEEE